MQPHTSHTTRFLVFLRVQKRPNRPSHLFLVNMMYAIWGLPCQNYHLYTQCRYTWCTASSLTIVFHDNESYYLFACSGSLDRTSGTNTPPTCPQGFECRVSVTYIDEAYTNLTQGRRQCRISILRSCVHTLHHHPCLLFTLIHRVVWEVCGCIKLGY